MDKGPSRMKDSFASPALSLSLAGVFRNAATPVEEEEDIGGGGRTGEMVEISSENTEKGCPSDEDWDTDHGVAEDDEKEMGNKKKRKNYHRHTAEQIRLMEELFKEAPHPDETQREQLSKQLGLAPKQVKFWFQNRRTQIKAMQERHENLLLKGEMEKLREENQAMRRNFNISCCPNCGFAASSKEPTMTTEELLRTENLKLKAEIEKLRGVQGRSYDGSASPSTSRGTEKQKKISLECYGGLVGIEKHQISEIVNCALDELTTMANLKEPLWIQSVETGREILNYDEYIRRFKSANFISGQVKQFIEASRESAVVFLDISRLIEAFMDVDQWKDMFPTMISQASTLDVIFPGEGTNRNGAIQLMSAEFQMLTPLVPTRSLYFVRYCKQLNQDKWAIMDVSVDKIEDNVDASLIKCRKNPSGCIIEDRANGHCKVTWVEHVQCNKTTIPTIYRSIVNNSLAYGARRWMAALQQHCERTIFFMATNVPIKDTNGVSTLAGRKSILRLAHRMTSSFCHAISESRHDNWTKTSTNNGEEVRFTTRRNINDPTQPVGLIISAVSSIRLPVATSMIFEFLRNDARRAEWDIVLNGGPPQTIVNVVKGKNRGNSVTVNAIESSEGASLWILEDRCINTFESTLVYAPVDVAKMQSVINGCDSSNVAILPSGFFMLQDSLEAKPPVVTSRNFEEGTLLTIAFQILADSFPASKLTMDSTETINNLISCSIGNIKKALHCEG